MLKFIIVTHTVHFKLKAGIRHLMNSMHVDIVPVLEDNYSYIVFDKETKDGKHRIKLFIQPENLRCLEGCLIDPSDPLKVLSRAREVGANIKMVLTTHHHWDHASGNGTIKKELPDVTIIGADSRVDHLDRLVKHEESWEVCERT